MSHHFVTAHLELTEGTDVQEALEMLYALAHDTRAEPGCVVFDVLQDLDNARRITLWECWQSPEDLATHFEYPHTKAALARGMTRVVSQAKLTAVSSAIARHGPES